MIRTFLSGATAREIQARFGTPVYVYDMATLVQQARRAQAMPNPFGLTVRFAMKACPNAVVLQLFHRLGLHIDASSAYEVYRAQHAGIPLSHIQLTAQEMPHDLQRLVDGGLRFNATSLHQLRRFSRLFAGHEVSIRVNPGLGSGHNRRANVGGPSSSFGIWHEQLDEARAIIAANDLRLTRLHSHIGSGADPAIWQRCAALTLDLARKLPDVQTVNLGGGFKVARAPDEQETDLYAVGEAIAAQLRRFRDEDDAHRTLHLEIEPGSYLVAHAGAIVSTIVDIKDTGPEGFRFVVVDSGMTENLRPSLYGAQHALTLAPADDEQGPARREGDYVVVGHCCESGDLLTPAPGDAGLPMPVRLPEPRIGDALIIADTGAYGASMAATNYNSFPQSAELLLAPDGQIHVIRRRQRWQEMAALEDPSVAQRILEEARIN